MKKTINIAKDFSKAPAGRYRDYGEYSAQRFREEFLAPAFKDKEITKIEIVLDGLDGIGASFWQEAFGNLIELEGISAEDIEEKLILKCSEDDILIPLIKRFIYKSIETAEWAETEEQIQGGFSEETIEAARRLYGKTTSDDVRQMIKELVKKALSKVRCRKSNLQEYQCCVMAKTPWESEKEHISFDCCLAKELFWLWDKGIITTGSCCGKHVGSKKNNSYIGVLPKYIDKMKELGYKLRINETDRTRKDSFVPKTNFNGEEK